MALGGAAVVQCGHVRDCRDRTEPQAVVQSSRPGPRGGASGQLLLRVVGVEVPGEAPRARDA
eukprot:9089848-Alexandrium_andersonii.AAC.1